MSETPDFGAVGRAWVWALAKAMSESVVEEDK